MKKINIVTVGGGTGSNVVLRALSKLGKHVEISAIVDVTDDGGSNRKIIDEFRLLPLSDIKQCINALYPKTNDLLAATLEKLFNYRFNEGNGIKGQHFGNLFIVALSDILNSQEKAVNLTQKILKIQGEIIPVSLEKGVLCAEYNDGSLFCSQHLINEQDIDSINLQIKKLFIQPVIKINPRAKEKLQEADFIIFCSGDLFTSLIANVIVDGFSECLKSSLAKKIYIMNLMTKFGQTLNFTASDHVKTIERYAGVKMNKIIINTALIPKSILSKTVSFRENQVVDDFLKGDTRILREDVVDFKIMNKHPADVLRRSFVLHDSIKLAKILEKLLYTKRL